MDVRRVVGFNLRRLRRRRGLSQERLALEIDVDRTYIGGIERGLRNPTISIVVEIANRLEVSLNELFRRPPNAAKPFRLEPVKRARRSPA
jgi:transcriptional regulator with XRE-family HTH domain